MATYLLDTTRNPWILTATGGSASLPLIITTDLVTIDRMEWLSENAAQNDEVQVLDSPPGVAAGSGREVWADFASGADQFTWQRQKTVRPMQGICVATLSSGTLRIFYA